MIKENFIKLYENSFRENWDLPCYTNYGEPESYTYGEVAEEIAKLHLLFKHCSLRRGDKIAVIGKNNARWCIAYMATITYGAIIVPILQDFNPNEYGWSALDKYAGKSDRLFGKSGSENKAWIVSGNLYSGGRICGF